MGIHFPLCHVIREYDRMKRYLLVDYIEIKEIQINVMISDYMIIFNVLFSMSFCNDDLIKKN